MKYFKLVIVLTIMFVLSCEEQTEKISINNNPEIEAARDFFLKNFTEQDWGSNGRVTDTRRNIRKHLDWQNAWVKNLPNNRKGVVIPVDFDKNLYAVGGDEVFSTGNTTYIMIRKDNVGKRVVEVISSFPRDGNRTWNSFSGIVTIEDWYGSRLKTLTYTNGVGKELNTANERTTTCSQEIVWFSCAGNDNIGWHCSYNYTETVFYTCDDGLGYDGCTSCYYYGDENNAGAGGSSGETGSGTSGTPSSKNDPVPDPGSLEDALADQWEESLCYIANMLNNECVMNVISKMSDLNVGYEVLTNFLGNEPTVDSLCFDIKILPNSVNGNTVVDQSGNLIMINLNGLNLNRSQLSIARTLLHEMIHAELFSMVIEAGGYSNFLSYAQNYNNEFLALWDYIATYEVNGWQHEYMADYYIQYIATGLEQLAPNLLSESFVNYWTGNGFYPTLNSDYIPWNWDDFYTALAWKGLTETQAWNQLDQGLRDELTGYTRQLELEILSYECSN